MTISFHYLRANSLTGGIEKVNRTLIKALNPSSLDSPYEPHESRLKYMLRQLTRPIHEDILLLAHINLAPAALILKIRKPSLKIWLMAHGIEIWEPQKGLKKRLLHITDRIFSVSNFTAEKIKSYAPEVNITVMPNCLAPDFVAPQGTQKPDFLLLRYGLKPEDKVLLCLTRLSRYEHRKHYDTVLEILSEIAAEYPSLRYLLAGKADAEEQHRLENKIAGLGLTAHVTFCGYVPEEELTAHYQLADLLVMPSEKEGFGLVFIEAMACGTPALGGNRDGSVDALTPYGHTVDPEDKSALRDKILQVLREGKPEGLAEKVKEQFGFERYAETWKRIVDSRQSTVSE